MYGVSIYTPNPDSRASWPEMLALNSIMGKASGHKRPLNIMNRFVLGVMHQCLVCREQLF